MTVIIFYKISIIYINDYFENNIAGYKYIELLENQAM